MEEKSRSRFAFIIAFILVVAVVYSFAVNFLGDTPSVRLADISDQTSQEPGAEDSQIQIEVTPQTVQNVVATLSRYRSYQRTVNVEYFGQGSSLGGLTAVVSVDNGWTRVDSTGQTGITEHSIVGEQSRWLWYGGDDSYVITAAGASAADLAQYLPTYEDVLAIETEKITAASYESRGGLPCIYVEVAEDELGYLERYWVSVESGLLVSAETVKDSELVYRMTAYQVESPLTETDGSFTLPDGTILHQVGS